MEERMLPLEAAPVDKTPEQVDRLIRDKKTVVLNIVTTGVRTVRSASARRSWPPPVVRPGLPLFSPEAYLFSGPTHSDRFHPPFQR